MNDKADFDKIFKEWYAHLFYFAYQFLNDSEASRDIVHDAFEYLWRNYSKVEQRTVKTYLYTIVKTRCIDYLRKQQVHLEYLDFASQIIQTVEIFETEEDDRIVRLHQAMKKLTHYNRHILEECFIKKKKYTEVAQELGVSVAAIHKNIVKALRILRQELKPEGIPKL